MADDSTGIWATAVGAIATIGAGVAAFRNAIRNNAENAAARRFAASERDGTAAARKTVDEENARLIDRLTEENERLERVVHNREMERDLWEARARRVDSDAHRLRHELINALFSAGRPVDRVPEIPLLEAPINKGPTT